MVIGLKCQVSQFLSDEWHAFLSFESTVPLSRFTSFEVIVQIYVERILRGSMTPSMGSSPFSRVKRPQLLDPRKT